MALAGGLLLLVIAGWFDMTIVRNALSDAQASFDMSGFWLVTSLGSMLVAGSVLLVGVVAWRAASVVVGLAYAVVGAFLIALPWLVTSFATSVNDVPPVLPGPVAAALGDLYFGAFGGSLNAVETIAAALLLSGLVALLRPWLGRGVAEHRSASVLTEVDPTPSSNAP